MGNWVVLFSIMLTFKTLLHNYGFMCVFDDIEHLFQFENGSTHMESINDWKLQSVQSVSYAYKGVCRHTIRLDNDF